MAETPSIQHFEQLMTQAVEMVTQQLSTAHTLDELEHYRSAWLGRNGQIPNLTATFKLLPAEARKILGPLFQQSKNTIQEEFAKKQILLEEQNLILQLKKSASFDVTAYKPNAMRGSLHPLTQLSQRIEDIFISMGYSIAHGPELETDFYNFEALNIPANHPARDMWDTLWLENSALLLRTHTSTVQIRTMEKTKPPFAIASLGRVYRHEATDATHDFMFNQVEGLLVAEGIALTHLLATLQKFFQSLFNKKSLNIRVRPGYFPFVEPGIEVDITCPFCKTGCSICKYSQWIEMGGAGLVHPNVLECSEIDSKKYSGFAFGMGVSRLAMFMYGIPDVRLLASSKLEFLRQF